MKKVLITGTAGFIGFHLAKLLLEENFVVHGYDGITDYYDVSLKQKRHEMLFQSSNFSATEGMLENQKLFDLTVDKFMPDVIVHLAAQAGVRYSLENPRAYLDSNVTGTFNVMEAARRHGVEHLLMASTSSVYGANIDMPFIETEKADTQLTIYAATKKANESMGHAYAHLYDLPTTMFRFFTVYGEWGRPDMLLFKIIKNSIKKTTLKLNNNGNHYRDFTYINDVVEILYRLSLKKINKKFDIFNICSNNPQFIKKVIKYFINSISHLKIKNISKNNLDVFKTHGDNKKIISLTNFKNFTIFNKGFKNTCKWYKNNL